MRNKILSVVCIALGLACQSNADTWALNYTTDSAVVNATLTTGAAVTTFEGNSGVLITGITGDRNGLALSLVATNVDPTLGASNVVPGWLFDNVVLSGGLFDYWGLEFSDSNNNAFNFFNQLYASNGTEYRENSDLIRTWSLKQVPDDSYTVALLGAVFVGLATFRRRLVS